MLLEKLLFYIWDFPFEGTPPLFSSHLYHWVDDEYGDGTSLSIGGERASGAGFLIPATRVETQCDSETKHKQFWIPIPFSQF